MKKKIVTCPACGADITRADKICPTCNTMIKHGKEKKLTCDKCGYYPIVISPGGIGECPVCKKTYLDL